MSYPRRPPPSVLLLHLDVVFDALWERNASGHQQAHATVIGEDALPELGQEEGDPNGCRTGRVMEGRGVSDNMSTAGLEGPGSAKRPEGRGSTLAKAAQHKAP